MSRAPAAILRELGLSPKKSLGQNFLTDPNVCRRIAEAAAPEGTGSVLEIGPGLGALTQALLARGLPVVAVDRDRDMIAFLSGELEPAITKGELQLIEADGTELDWLSTLSRLPAPYAIAGNLPYLVTGRFLELATRASDRIARAVFMVQLEVAERLLSAPSSKAYGALTVFVRAAFQVERVMVVKSGCFYPRPDVDSAVVKLTPRPDRIAETESFRKLVRAAFQQRRKTLRNAWGALGLGEGVIEQAAQASGVDLGRRGETLSELEFASVARALEG